MRNKQSWKRRGGETKLQEHSSSKVSIRSGREREFPDCCTSAQVEATLEGEEEEEEGRNVRAAVCLSSIIVCVCVCVFDVRDVLCVYSGKRGKGRRRRRKSRNAPHSLYQQSDYDDDVDSGGDNDNGNSTNANDGRSKEMRRNFKK